MTKEEYREIQDRAHKLALESSPVEAGKVARMLHDSMKQYHINVRRNWKVVLYDLGTGRYVTIERVSRVTYDTVDGMVLKAVYGESYNLSEYTIWVKE